MPFLPLYNIAQYQNLKQFPKIAKVINNNDPKKLGRIKVELPGMYEPEDSLGTNLPWIRKLQDNFLCGSGEMFSVPDVGALIEIVWPYDNTNAFYRGIPYGTNTSTGKFVQDYPNEWGWTDGTFELKVNKNTHDFVLKNNVVTIIGTGDGNLSITGTNISVTGDAVTVDASTVDVSASAVNINAGNVKIGGSTTIDNKVFLSHQHTNGNDGKPTGGVI